MASSVESRPKWPYFENGQFKSDGQDFFQNPRTALPVKRKLAAVVEYSTGKSVIGTDVHLLRCEGEKYRVAFAATLNTGQILKWEIAYTQTELLQTAAMWVHGPDPALWDGFAAASLMVASLPAGAVTLAEEGAAYVAAVGLKVAGVRAAAGAAVSVAINEGISRALGRAPDWHDRATSAAIGAVAGPLTPNPELSLLQAVQEARAGEFALQGFGRGVTLYGPMGAAGSMATLVLHPERGLSPPTLISEAAAGYVGGATMGPAFEIGFYGAGAVARDAAKFSGPGMKPAFVNASASRGMVEPEIQHLQVCLEVGVPHGTYGFQSIDLFFDDLLNFAEAHDNSLNSHLLIWKSQFSGKKITVAIFYDAEGQFHIEPKGIGIKPHVPSPRAQPKWVCFFQDQGASIPSFDTVSLGDAAGGHTRPPGIQPVSAPTDTGLTEPPRSRQDTISLPPHPPTEAAVPPSPFPKMHATDPTKILGYLDRKVLEFNVEPDARSSLALGQFMEGLNPGTKRAIELPNGLVAVVVRGEKGDFTVTLTRRTPGRS